jgi:[FeFe] hydrogenase H-cluster maturation GTPase HydF
MPQGRLILPQVQVLRDVLDAEAIGYVAKETELERLLQSLKEKPALVITDSQVFGFIKDAVPADIPLTSFSTIFARHKGDLDAFVNGARAIDRLRDNDRILVAEACTHHAQPEDIGRVKIPMWLKKHTGKELLIDVTAGGDFPQDITPYKLIIQCGGCMVNRREIMYRINRAKQAGISITNYGILIGYLNGMLERIIKPFNIKTSVIVATDVERRSYE